MHQSALTLFQIEFVAAAVGRYCHEQAISDEKVRAALRTVASAFFKQGATTEEELIAALELRASMLRANEI